MYPYIVKPICLGYSAADLSGFTYMAFPGTPLAIDITYFLILGGPKNILVDSGTSANRMAKYWPGETIDIQSFEESLRAEGLIPRDIDIVIQTHLHHDHMANTVLCNNAEVYIQVEEWAFAQAPHPLQAQYYPKDLLESLKQSKLRLIRGDLEIFPGIRILHTPGHTPGTQSVCVQTKTGRTMIAGMCSVYQTFDSPSDVLPTGHPFQHWEVFATSIASDLQQAYNSCLQVKRLADVLLPCHGPGFTIYTEQYLPSKFFSEVTG